MTTWTERTQTWAAHNDYRGNPVPEHTSTIWTSERVSYGVKDAKGRTVGGYASIVRCSSYVSPDAYHVSTHATRDGKGFGAAPRSTPALTLEEAKALASAKLAQAAKRFAKLAAQGDGKQWVKAVAS